MTDRVTERRAFLEKYLEGHARLLGPRRGRAYEVLRERGEFFTWSPHGYEYGEAKMCFRNAIQLVLGAGEFDPEAGLTYCEGYVSTADLPIPIHHAWAVDRDERVVDPTLRHLGTECGFCLGNGVRVIEDEGDEEECSFCGGTGELDRTHPDRSGTVYIGLRVEIGLLRRALLETGTYGVFDSDIFWREINSA